MKLISKILFILTIGYPGIYAHSQTCCSGGIPISGNIGMPFSNGGSLQLNMGYDLNYLGLLKNGTDRLDDDTRRRITQSVLMNAAYALNDQFSIELLSTFVRQDRIIISDISTNHDFASGLGDAVILLRYSKNIFSDPGSNLMFGIGPKIPLGRSDIANESGILLNADMQPGSGSWDMISFLQYSFAPIENASLRSFIRLSYNARGENKNYLDSHTYKSGNEFTASVGINDMISLGESLWNYSVSGKLRTAKGDELDGFRLPNTGGHWEHGA